MPTDPVCRRQIDKSTPFKTAMNGRTFYFCSEDCAEEFVENSSEYLELEEESAIRYAEE